MEHLRNIRYQIKSASHNGLKRNQSFKDNTYSNSFSKDISQSLINTYLSNKSQNYIAKRSPEKINSETNKAKEEAKSLIEQTKKMMEEYSLNKYSKKPARLTERISQEKLDQLSNSSISYENISAKLINQNKQIKNLEKLLKEKTTQNKILQDKLNEKNSELEQLKDCCDYEKNNSLKVQNIKLNRKIYAAEKSNNDNIKKHERIINDLKFKINDLNNQILSIDTKNKNLINDNIILKNDNDKFKNLLKEQSNINLDLQDKINNLQKINDNYLLQIDDLKINLGNIIVVLKTLYTKETQAHAKRNIFLENFMEIIKDGGDLVKNNPDKFNDKYNSEMEFSKKIGDFEYDRINMNDVDILTKLNK